MTEYWKSTQRYQCQVCRQWVPDHPTSKIVHERSDRHQQALKSMLERATTLGPRPRSTVPPEVAPGLAKIDRVSISSLKAQNLASNMAPSGTDLYKTLKEKYGEDHDHFSVNELENQFAGDSKWEMHWDKQSEKYFYYNRLTRRSQWDKPQNFDGYDPTEEKEEEEASEEPKSKKNESIIGGWVDVDSPKAKVKSLPQLPEISEPRKEEKGEKEKDEKELTIELREQNKQEEMNQRNLKEAGEANEERKEDQTQNQDMIKRERGIQEKEAKKESKASELKHETEKMKAKLVKQQIDSEFVRTMYEVEENKSSGQFKKRKGGTKMNKNYHNN